MPKTNKISNFLKAYLDFKRGYLGFSVTSVLNLRLFKAISLALVMLAFSTGVSLAQERTISGKVVDATGSGIPGISVYVKGTSKGTVTDADGNYQLSVAEGSILVVQGVGYKTTETPVGAESTLNISVEDDIANLDEIVVTGYSVDNRRETSGSVSIVKAKDLAVVPSGNVEQQLQGRVAGVTVITNGQPGTTSQIRVRGFGAFGGNEPLYVVDGVPVPSIDFLNPDDIESTTVLKDAAAASIYGARASNGVIVYTTKHGKKGSKKLNVTYDGMVGFTDPGKGQAMMNPTDFAAWTWKSQINSGKTIGTGKDDFSHPQFGANPNGPVIPDYLVVGTSFGVTGTVDLAAEKLKYNVDPTKGSVYQVVKANKEGTDWYKAITRTAPITRHTIGLSGASETARYYIGMSLQNQKGVLLSSGFKRYAFRVNTEFDILKNLRIGENLQFTYRQTLGITGGSGGQGIAADENDILQAFRMPSIIPVYDEFGGYAGTAAKGFNNPRNPRANQDGLLNNRNFNGNGVGNIYIEYEPIKGLTLRSSIGGQYNNYYYWGYSRLQYENSENNSAFGYNEGSGYNFQWNWTNTVNYKKTFGQHSIDVLAGMEALNTGSGRQNNANGLNPFVTDPNYINMSTVDASGRVINSINYNGVNFYSMFGRANYTFNDKYIVSLVVRRDGSSRFGATNRYGVFPAASVAWRISAENFMKSLTWINDLKIRGGYGAMGNSNNVDPNNQYSLYGGSVGASAYDINGSNSSVVGGFYRTRIGNPFAKWETSITKNIGFDGTFLNGKLDIVFDLWQKDTKDLLFQVPVPATLGPNAAAPSVNVGKMLNRGIDIQIITRGKIKSAVGYEITVNGGFLHNEIVALSDGQTYITSVNPGFRGINPIRNQLGYSLSSFYGYQVQGLFQTQSEVDAAPAQDGKGVGRFRYSDLNGDGKIDDKDRTYLGSPVPKFTGGLNFKFTYKGFELESYMFLSTGNKIFNVSKWFTDFYPSFAGAAISERVKDSWTPQNTGASIPIFENASNFSTNTQSSSFYIENGGYFRMQNITLAYNFPQTMLEKLKIQRLRVFASTNNVFTITKYSGLDPSVGGNADTNFGIDVGNYPITRSFTFGVNFGL